MKRMRFWVTGTVFMLLFVALLIGVNTVTVFAAEKYKEQCDIISLRGNLFTSNVAQQQQIITITPQYTEVPLGACIVWINWVRGPEISVTFKEGKTCSSTTEAAIGFKFNPETGCYVTDYLPMGATSSLRFMEPGTYAYEIYAKGKVAPVATGKITVKK